MDVGIGEVGVGVTATARAVDDSGATSFFEISICPTAPLPHLSEHFMVSNLGTLRVMWPMHSLRPQMLYFLGIGTESPCDEEILILTVGYLSMTHVVAPMLPA